MVTRIAQESIAYGETGARLLLDAVAVTALAIGLSYRRHHRRDLVVLYAVFNAGLFAATIAIQDGAVGGALGFGLFAVLSIIRLRAETLTNPEIAYFFAAIVLALVAAVDLGGVGGNAALALVVLGAAFLADHPAFLRGHIRMEITLDRACTDPEAARRLVEERVGGRVIALELSELDFVREVTRVDVRLAP